MDVIPAIDLLEGRCVRLFQGDYQQAQVVGHDPVAMALHWASLGAPRMHIVDLGGAKAGHLTEQTVIAEILAKTPCPVQVGGGIRSLETIQWLIAHGADRVILGTVALEDPDLVTRACGDYPGQIWIALDSRAGKIATRGWLTQSVIDAVALAQQLEPLGVAGWICTDIAQDGTLAGPNLAELRRLCAGVKTPVIASGGIASVEDLVSLSALIPQGLSGAILGQSLYKGTIDLTQAIRAVGNPRWQDVIERPIC